MDSKFTRHVGHTIEMVMYADDWAIECTDCYEVILDQEVWGLLTPKKENTNG